MAQLLPVLVPWVPDAPQQRPAVGNGQRVGVGDACRRRRGSTRLAPPAPTRFSRAAAAGALGDADGTTSGAFSPSASVGSVGSPSKVSGVPPAGASVSVSGDGLAPPAVAVSEESLGARC